MTYPIPVKRLKNGFELPAFGIGTWTMGGRYERDPKNDDEADIRAIQAALKLGVKHIDTAELYAGGCAEELVGRAIKPFPRENLFIASKVKGDRAPEEIRRACETSLRLLKTDYLNLYLFHWYEEGAPLRAVAREMERLVDEKMVQHIGLSNFGPDRFGEFQSYVRHKIVCDQVHYNLLFREPERKGLLDYCMKNDVMLVAWRPTEKGLFGKNPPLILQDTARKYGKTLIQVAINWLVSQPNVATIAKSTHLKHLEENLGAVGWQLLPEDIELLRSDYPNQQPVSDTVELG